MSSDNRDSWCIENDLVAQQEMAAIHAAKEASAELEHIHQLTSALKACLKLLNEKYPEVYGIGNHAIIEHSMALIKRSECF
jgi:hypothetical protein